MRRRSQPLLNAIYSNSHPRRARALVFPGQGAQVVGMGKHLADTFPESKRVFDEADHILGFSLSNLVFHGSQEELTRTENAQPAILTTSIAILRALQEERHFDVGRDVDYALGHSLGEYSALVATNALSFADAVRLVRLRGQAMQRAADAISFPTRMTALVVQKGKLSALRRWCEDKEARRKDLEAADGIGKDEFFSLANINSSNQVVLSGTTEAVEWAASRLSRLGIASQREVTDALSEITVRPPVIPVVSNVTAEPITFPSEIRTLLAKQVTSPVEWCKSLSRLRYGKIVDDKDVSMMEEGEQGIEEWICIGPGPVMRNLIRKEMPEAVTWLVDSVGEVDEFSIRGTQP